MNALQTWLKSLPPAWQTFFYAVETGVATVIIIFLSSLYGAFTSPHGLDGFDWHGQLYTLAMGVGAAIIKALIDFLKGTPPTQIAS